MSNEFSELFHLCDMVVARDAEIERLMNAMELAWGLIANGQYWDRTDGRRYGEWNDARLRWRDEHWHPALDRNREATRGH